MRHEVLDHYQYISYYFNCRDKNKAIKTPLSQYKSKNYEKEINTVNPKTAWGFCFCVYLEKSVVFSKVQFGMFKCSKASVLVVIDDPFGAWNLVLDSSLNLEGCLIKDLLNRVCLKDSFGITYIFEKTLVFTGKSQLHFKSEVTILWELQIQSHTPCALPLSYHINLVHVQ